MNTDTEKHFLRVLLVEDDAQVREALTQCLMQRAYVVSMHDHARSAINAAQTQGFDLAIVDLRLPDIQGGALIRSLRRCGFRFPILAITALPAIDERVGAMDAGATDYLTKPFSMDALESRLDVLIRRSRDEDSPHPICIGNLTVEPGNPQVLIGGHPVYLSGQELALLEVLARNAGRLVRTDELALHLSRSSTPVTDTTVSVHVHRLRARLLSAGVQIRTLRGFGYLLEQSGGPGGH